MEGSCAQRLLLEPRLALMARVEAKDDEGKLRRFNILLPLKIRVMVHRGWSEREMGIAGG